VCRRCEYQIATGHVVEAEYRPPFAAHAMLELQAALVDMQPQGTPLTPQRRRPASHAIPRLEPQRQAVKVYGVEYALHEGDMSNVAGAVHARSHARTL
jgi:hypothetical protein